MSKLLYVLLVATAVGATDEHAVPPSGDTQTLLQLTLKAERRLHPAIDKRETCLRRGTYAIAFTGDRILRQGYLKEINSGRTEPFLRKAHEDAGKPEYRWRSPTSTTEFPEVLNLPNLNQIASDLIISPPPVNSDTTFDVAELSDFPTCRRKNDSRPTLGVSAPAVFDGHAFVETGVGCGMLCGNGLLYAYRKTDVGWQLIAVADTWIS